MVFVPITPRVVCRDTGGLGASLEQGRPTGAFHIGDIWSQRQHIRETCIIPSDAGRRMGKDVANLIVEYACKNNHTLYSAKILYDTSVARVGEYTFDESLLFCMNRLYPLVVNTKVVKRPVDTALTMNERGDRPWQQLSTHLVSGIQTVPDPLYQVAATTITSEDGQTLQLKFTRSGWYHVAACSLRTHVTGAWRPASIHIHGQDGTGATLTFRGGMVFQDTGTGKTRVAINVIRNNHREAPPAAPRRVFFRTMLPSTSLVVVPSHTIDGWQTKIYHNWPECKLYVVTRLVHLVMKHDGTRKRKHGAAAPVAVRLADYDVVLLSRNVFFKDVSTTLRPKKDIWTEVATVTMLKSHFNTTIVDEAHAYLDSRWPPGCVQLGAGMTLLRALASAQHTVLLTATPKLTHAYYHALQYAVLIGTTHSLYGDLAPRPLSYTETRIVQHLSHGHVVHHPSRAHHGSRDSRLMLDPMLQQSVLHAFYEHVLVHMDATHGVPVLHSVVGFVPHPGRRLFRTYAFPHHQFPEKLYIHSMGQQQQQLINLVHTEVYVRHNQQGRVVYQHPSVPYRQQLLDAIAELYTDNLAISRISATHLHLSTPHTTTMDQCLLDAANQVPVTTEQPIQQYTMAMLRVLVALQKQKARVLVYKPDPDLVLIAKKHHNLNILSLQGNAVHLSYRLQQFEETKEHNVILAIHPRHIDGTDLPSATHIVVPSNIDNTVQQQLVGRATRYGRTSVVRIITVTSRE